MPQTLQLESCESLRGRKSSSKKKEKKRLGGGHQTKLFAAANEVLSDVTKCIKLGWAFFFSIESSEIEVVSV